MLFINSVLFLYYYLIGNKRIKFEDVNNYNIFYSRFYFILIFLNNIFNKEIK